MNSADQGNRRVSASGTEQEKPRLRDAWRHPGRFARQLVDSAVGLQLIGVASFLVSVAG